MAEDTVSLGQRGSSSNVSAFMRALLAPLFTWAAMVALATMGGQPGVVCVTPMAWLLGLWVGSRYAVRMLGEEPRKVYLGAALVGVVLGLSLGLLFALGVTQMAPDPTNAQDIARTQGLTIFMFVAGMVICPLLSMFTAWLNIRRLALD